MYKSVLFILLTLTHQNLFAQSFKICYESPHFFPYNEKGSKNQPLSPVIVAIYEAAENSGLKAELIRASWARCLKDIEENKFDAILTSLWSENRDKIAVFPKDKNNKLDTKLHFFKANYKVYTHSNSKLKWDGKVFQNITKGVGAPKDYIANEKLKKMKVLKETDLKVKQAFDLIIKKRLDAYVVLDDVAEIILKEYPTRDLIKSLDKDFITDYLYIPVSKGFYEEYPNKTTSFFKELAIARIKYISGN